jgi:hypothetical protein
VAANVKALAKAGFVIRLLIQMPLKDKLFIVYSKAA